MQDFLIEVVNRLDVSEDGVHVAMVLFADDPHVEWKLNQRPAYNKAILSRRISRLPYPSGRTATPGGLLYARTEVLEAYGQR